MIKIFITILVLFNLSYANDYERANNAARNAFKELDCEFEDCHKEEQKPKVIIKEKIVEKPVIVEKVKVVKQPVIVEKVIYKDKPQVEKKIQNNTNQEKKAISNFTYNKAFFDMYPKSQAPMLDYITFDSHSSFDIKQYIDSVTKIKEKNLKVYIHGKLEVPSSITTKQVYIYSGKKYYYNYYGYWQKFIYYNNSNTAQNSDYFLVDVKTDSSGNRYVDYKIYFLLEYPWKLKASEENVAPNCFFFKMAPNVRGFKNKFISVKPYIIDE